MHRQKNFTIFVLEILLKYQVTNGWLKNLLKWSNKEADFFPELKKKKRRRKKKGGGSSLEWAIF